MWIVTEFHARAYAVLVVAAQSSWHFTQFTDRIRFLKYPFCFLHYFYGLLRLIYKTRCHIY